MENAMPNPKRRRGELPPDRLDEAADPRPVESAPHPNRNTKDDGRGRDARRTGSDSNPD